VLAPEARLGAAIASRSQHQEGNGAGDGVRLHDEEQSSEGRNPKGGSGMKQGR
jgi:hypothetical protein